MIWLKRIKSSLIRFFLKLSTKKKLRGSRCGKNIKAERGLVVKNPQYIEIGDYCYFGPNCRIEAWDRYLSHTFSPSIILGEDVRINSTCHIGCINKVSIGAQTLLGSHVMITDHAHGNNSLEQLHLHPSERPLYSKGEVEIGKRCWICENVVILPNVHIGDEVIIGANSVVTKDIPSRCVAAGNPAKVIRVIDK